MLIKLPHIILLTTGLMLSAAPSGLVQCYADVHNTRDNGESHLEQRGYDMLAAYGYSQAREFGELDDDEGLDARGSSPPSFSPGLQRRSELASKLEWNCRVLLEERNPVSEYHAPKYSWHDDQERLQKRGRSRAHSDEAWRKISDLADRKRIQNRISQRNYRKKLQRKRVKQHTETTGKSDAGSKRPATQGTHK